MVHISSKAKEDIKKGLGYIIKTALSLSMPLVTMLLIESPWIAEWITFAIGIYNASVIVALVLIDKHLGTFTTAELENARGIAQQSIEGSVKNIQAVDNSETQDIIEAKRAGISIEDFKEEKYGDPSYDYGKGTREKAEAEAKRLELMKQLEMLNAQYPIEESSPAPEVEPTPVIETLEEPPTT